MHAWLFRHLHELRPIYGVDPSPRVEPRKEPRGRVVPAPGTLRRAGDEVRLAPMRSDRNGRRDLRA